jgi:hypothetical protein
MRHPLLPVLAVLLCATPSPAAVEPRALPIEVFAPTYPPLIHQALMAGTVQVAVTIAPSGNVVQAKAIKSSYAALVPSSEQSALRWRFTPSQGSSNRSAVLSFEFILVHPTGDPEAVPIGTRFIPPYRVQLIQVGR